jgi:hypothetical protein
MPTARARQFFSPFTEIQVWPAPTNVDDGSCARWTRKVEAVNISLFAEHSATTLTAKNRSKERQGDFVAKALIRKIASASPTATGIKIA